MKQLKLKVSQRKTSGSAESGRLRKQGKIPAVIYGKSGVQHVLVDEPDFRKLMRAAAGSASLLELSDDQGGSKLTLIKEIQRNPIKDNVMHVDFQEVSPNEPMHAVVPVHIVGESYGVKNENGVLEAHMHSINIRCLPKHLPEYIEVNIDDLHAGHSIHVKDIKAIEGVSFLEDAGTTIVSCAHERKVVEEEEVVAEAAIEAPAAEEGGEEAAASAPSA